MKRFAAIVCVCVAAGLMAGCELLKTAAAKTPQPPPTPVVKPAPPPPPEPLSVPQTRVQLPPPQPITAAAMATLEEQLVVELPKPPVQPPTRRVPTAGVPPLVKPAEVPAPASGTTAAATQTTPPAEERPQVRDEIREALTPEEQKRLGDSMTARDREIVQNTELATARGLSTSESAIINRINSFKRLSGEAKARGDLRQADALLERAQILSRELGAR